MPPIVDQGKPEMLFGEEGIFREVPCFEAGYVELCEKWNEFVVYVANPVVVSIKDSTVMDSDEDLNLRTEYVVGLVQKKPDGKRVARLYGRHWRVLLLIHEEDIGGLDIEYLGRFEDIIEPQDISPETLIFDFSELGSRLYEVGMADEKT